MEHFRVCQECLVPLGFLRTLLSYLTLRSVTHCPPPSLGWCACAPPVLWLGAGAGRHLRHPGLRASGGRHHLLPPAPLLHVDVGEGGLSVKGVVGCKNSGQHPEWHQPLASQQARSVLHLFLIRVEIQLGLPSYILLKLFKQMALNELMKNCLEKITSTDSYGLPVKPNFSSNQMLSWAWTLSSSPHTGA